MQALEDKLGWQFRDQKLLVQALTHSTFANEHPGTGPHNERLEYLGDAVLNLLAASILYECFPEDAEGELSRKRTYMVRTTALARLGAEWRMGEFLRLGQGQKRDGTPQNSRILANSIEALAGALYLDGGYLVVEKCFGEALRRQLSDDNHFDFKTELQELCHRLGLPQPIYRVISEAGPAHSPCFTCGVRVGEEIEATALGGSKKHAEQQSAKAVVENLSLQKRSS